MGVIERDGERWRQSLFPQMPRCKDKGKEGAAALSGDVLTGRRRGSGEYQEGANRGQVELSGNTSGTEQDRVLNSRTETDNILYPLFHNQLWPVMAKSFIC